MHIMQSRRDFLASASLATAAGILDPQASLADEPPPETTTIRLGFWPQYACVSPHTIAEALLRAEGFTDVRFVVPVRRSPCSRACMSAVTSCSCTSRSARSAI